MKVVYQDHIEKRIRDAIYAADVAGRHISHIEVTVSEANELSRWVWKQTFISPTSNYRRYTPNNAGEMVITYSGVDIYVVPK